MGHAILNHTQPCYQDLPSITSHNLAITLWSVVGKITGWSTLIIYPPVTKKNCCLIVDFPHDQRASARLTASKSTEILRTRPATSAPGRYCGQSAPDIRFQRYHQITVRKNSNIPGSSLGIHFVHKMLLHMVNDGPDRLKQTCEAIGHRYGLPASSPRHPSTNRGSWTNSVRARHRRHLAISYSNGYSTGLMQLPTASYGFLWPSQITSGKARTI